MTSPASLKVMTLDLNLVEPLKRYFNTHEFTLTTPPHTLFSARKPGLSCTFYESGKFVIQGKDSPEFIEFVLEPEFLKEFSLTYPASQNVNFIPHIGIDESGKGDFFGPLCIAGVYVNQDQASLLQKIGVKDSKTLGDTAIKKMAREIKSTCFCHTVTINPSKYNTIYKEFKNLNFLLAWGHATAIEELINKTNCNQVIIDQFADESIVIRALKRKNLDIDLTQRHRAEEDIAVAAASILARNAFLEGLDRLGKEIGIPLPKGASAAVKQTGKLILTKLGDGVLRSVCKEHFKTLDFILGMK